MEKIKIAITGRVASVVALPEVVADNAEYEVDFALDPREGWDMSLPITALFVRRDGSYTPRIMDAGKTSCTMPPQTGTNIVFVGLTQDDMRTTTPAAIKVHRSIRTVAHDPLPAPSEDVYAQILAAYAGIKILSGKGAPTSATQGEVNQLYRDEDTQKLYICTATDGGYTWAAVSGGSVDVDAALTKAGYAADAKAAGDAIGKKIDAPQVAQVGEVLTVEEVDADGKPKKWKTAPAAAEQKQADWNQNDETAADYVKNRPFYTKRTKKSAQTYEITEIPLHVIDPATLEGFPVFEKGDAVSIIVNGVEYSMVASYHDGGGNGPSYSYICDNPDGFSTDDFTWLLICNGGHIQFQSKVQSTVQWDSETNVTIPVKYSPLKIRYAYKGDTRQITDLHMSKNILNRGGFRLLESKKEDGTILYNLANYGDVLKAISVNGGTAGDNKYLSDKLNEVQTFNAGVNSAGYSELVMDLPDTVAISEFYLNNIQYTTLLVSTRKELESSTGYSGMLVTEEGYIYTIMLNFNKTQNQNIYETNWTYVTKRIM